MVLLINCNRGQLHNGVKLSAKYVSSLFSEKIIDSSVEYSIDYKNLKQSLIDMAYKCIDYSKDFKHNIFVGGDHLSAFSTVLSSLIKYGNDFKLVWIDAHADIHSFESSPSWNLHGMVVRLLMTHSINGIPTLKPEQIFYIGLRSVEDAEWTFIHENKIRYISAEMIFSNRREYYLANLKNFVSNNNVHISLDIDAFDDSLINSTGTPESGGLNIEDFKNILNIVRTVSTHYATDLMEINPELGDSVHSDKTIKTIARLIEF